MSKDTIYRQAAIAYSISGMTREIDGDKWIRVSEVRESLKTMPSAQPEQRWIPVGERLPTKPYECVLCYYGKNDHGLNFIDEDGEWYIDGVVSWMPIPEQ